jgi:hypothetical protein
VGINGWHQSYLMWGMCHGGSNHKYLATVFNRGISGLPDRSLMEIGEYVNMQRKAPGTAFGPGALKRRLHGRFMKPTFRYTKTKGMSMPQESLESDQTESSVT